MTGYDKVTLKRAKALRRDLTDAERALWQILRGCKLDGSKWRRQQPIGPFIADFVCQEHRLIVEADGGQHSENAADRHRTMFLSEKGYRVLPFWNNDIVGNVEGVITIIAEALSAPHPAQPPAESPSPSRGEGSGVPHA